MKTRDGFVSNSSSSSFVVNKSDLTEEQIVGIRNHTDSKQFKDCQYSDRGDEWTILEEEDAIMGYTWMDNFDMIGYMQELGVDVEKVVEVDDTLPAVAWMLDTDVFKDALEGESDEDA